MQLFWGLYDAKTEHGRERMAGCLIRTAGHDLMDFRRRFKGDPLYVSGRHGWRKNSIGGSDGCINFEDPDNKGIKTCMMESNV